MNCKSVTGSEEENLRSKDKGGRRCRGKERRRRILAALGMADMFNECRIGKQFRRVRKLLLNVTATVARKREENERGEKSEKASRNTEAEDEQSDKLFP